MSKNESNTQKDFLAILFRQTAIFFTFIYSIKVLIQEILFSFVKVIIIIFIPLDMFRNTNILDYVNRDMHFSSFYIEVHSLFQYILFEFLGKSQVFPAVTNLKVIRGFL